MIKEPKDLAWEAFQEAQSKGLNDRNCVWAAAEALSDATGKIEISINHGQRYRAATCDCGDTREPEPAADGAWVRYVDYAQLQQQLAQESARANTNLEALNTIVPPLRQQVERLTQGQAEGNDLITLYKAEVARLRGIIEGSGAINTGQAQSSQEDESDPKTILPRDPSN